MPGSLSQEVLRGRACPTGESRMSLCGACCSQSTFTPTVTNACCLQSTFTCIISCGSEPWLSSVTCAPFWGQMICAPGCPASVGGGSERRASA